MGDRRAARRTPQEDKQLSYAKDRRNNYGENDKSSRKSIRLRKRLVNRANRHHDQQIVGSSINDIATAEAAELNLLSERRKRWRKCPDVALGAHVERSLAARQKLATDQTRTPARPAGHIAGAGLDRDRI